MKFYLNLLFFVFSLISFSSCLKDNIASEEQSKLDENLKQISELNTAQGQGLSLSSSNNYFYKKLVENSSGHVFDVSNQVYLAYTISTIEGAEKLRILPSDSVYFGVSGVNSTIPAYIFSGFAYPIYDLKVGEKAVYYFPSTLAFGDKPQLGFKSWEPVKLEIEILDHFDENKQIDVYMKKNNLVPTEITSKGLRFILTEAKPSGDSLKTGDEVTVKYNGKFLNGTSFDSGNFDTIVNSNSTVAGFNDGIAKMRVGEKATLIFPSSIGYGPNGYDKIPGYSPLRFDIEIVSKK